MNFYDCPVTEVLTRLSVNPKIGIETKKVDELKRIYGENKLDEKKPKSVVKRLIEALFEPMMLILVVAFTVTLGINVCRYIKGEETEFYECIGILIAIAVSTVLTVVMEGKSERAFRLLDKMGSNGLVKVLRDGYTKTINKVDLVVGDIVYIEAGNEIPADGRIIRCNDFSSDESTLTGESLSVTKNHTAIFKENTPLAERLNFVFAGTLCEKGSCVYVVTATGSNCEIGKIARDVTSEKSVSAPLKEKLKRLGNLVTIFGVISSIFVFILSIVRLYLTNGITFDGVQEIFVQSIVLIVAAVPEGLPTTVAISLTLNVLRLAKSNALIRKLVATETIGSVSVICSDKTGTLTKNQMTVEKVVPYLNQRPKSEVLKLIAYNSIINSTTELLPVKSGKNFSGSATEFALLKYAETNSLDYRKIRKSGAISPLTPFSSQNKYMETKFTYKDKSVVYLKGAPEVVLKMCLLSNKSEQSVLTEISRYQSNGDRVIAFASSKGGTYDFDGFAVISDGLRDDVKKAVASCLKAGVKVKMLTGDNIDTARKIAEEAGIYKNGDSVVTADYVDGLNNEELKNQIENISVIARSTPQTKLRVVTALQSLGEVVAVTGDGVNDAPAIKHADIGIAMGDGSEITKQASDVVLLDNSFSTILKAISFGRNVYSNFQRFISFQLTVNLASMCIIIASLISGFESPFSSTCLLWLNVIMDGPLALSLGLEMRRTDQLSKKPVRRTDDILSGKLLIRIALHSAYCALVVVLQRYLNFLNVDGSEEAGVVVTAFVFFQVFNAINCRETTSSTALKGVFSNKLLVLAIAITYTLHVIIITNFPQFFGVERIGGDTVVKVTLVSLSIIAFSETYKALYRFAKTITAKRKEKSNKAKFSINEKRLVT